MKEYIIEDFENGYIKRTDDSGLVFTTSKRDFYIRYDYKDRMIVNHGWLDDSIASKSPLCSAQEKALRNRMKNNK